MSLTDLVESLVKNDRFQIGINLGANGIDHFNDAQWLSSGKIEGLARKLRISAQRFCQIEVRINRILDVNVIADESAVRTYHRTLAAEERANGSGNDAIPVQVAAAKEIAAAGDRDRDFPGFCIALRDHIGA